MSNVSKLETTIETDYIIVGAGSAGCLLANRLSADSQVVLIEAGGKDNWHWIHVPVGYLYCIGNERTDWCFKTTSDPGINDRSLSYPRGKVLGGSSSINGMLYLRGQSADYDGWESLGNKGWGWNDVLPLFKYVEKHHLGASEFHGGDGNWLVEKQRLHWPVLDSFLQAAGQAGIPETKDFNTGDNFGCGYFEVNQHKGVRWNASKAFLHPILDRQNLKLLMKSQVEKIDLENKKAIGAYCICNGRRVYVKARKEIILAAGSVGSTQLLQLSGIGSAKIIEKAGVKPVHELPGVGQNLQDHLQLRMIFKLQGAKTLNTLANSIFGKMNMGLEYLMSRRGPLSMAPSQLGAFAYSDDSQSRPNIEFHVQPLSLDKFGEPLHEFPAMTAASCNLRPTSRGHINITSPDFNDQPEIFCNYLNTEEDLAVAADSLRLTRKIMSQKAMSGYNPEEYLPGSSVRTQEDLEKAAGNIGTTIFHPVGTCKMGIDDMAVVDPKLCVHGIKNLRVADASVMPLITSGNTNSPTIMIAEKASRMILDKN